MKKNKLLFIVFLIVLSKSAAAEDISNRDLNPLCDLLNSKITGDMLVDAAAYDACLTLKRKINKDVENDLSKYPVHNVSEIHKAASVNEFEARKLMGEPYGMLNVKVKRVQSTADGEGAVLDIYNGGDNPYIFSKMIIPFNAASTKLDFWIRKANEGKEKLSHIKDGGIITVVCSSDNFKAYSQYSESFGQCLYFSQP